MKWSMPFLGVRVPVMRKTARAVFERYPPACVGILPVYKGFRKSDPRPTAVYGRPR